MERIEKILIMKRRLVELGQIIKSKKYAWSERTEARYLHMIYGVFRGVPMERIEAKCRETLSSYWLEKYTEKFDVEVDCEQIICHSRSVTF